MADGGWSFSDWNSMSGVGALVVTLGGLIHLRGRKDKTLETVQQDAKSAHDKAEAVAHDLADYKVKAVEKFATKDTFDLMETRISVQFERLGDRIGADMRALGTRIDGIRDSRSRE